MIKIPKTMSTQHPDNVDSPFFAENHELHGEDEIQEAYYAFSHLGCDEQMWDCEGKEADGFVIKKLLTKYETFFEKKRLGRDLFVTLRVPNPLVEKAEGKILLETLESIPRSFDASRLVYGDEVPPIFEVILPMTTSSECLDRIYNYYSRFVIGKQNQPLHDGDITVAKWIGKFGPEKINVIPLFEDKKHMLNAHKMVGIYLRNKDVDYQRVFLARSDPAMNYGLVSAVLLNKIALLRLQRLSEEIGVTIYPIVGTGPAPFRGNMRPQNADRVAKEYSSAQTFTIQSSFKYDNSPDDVRHAIKKLNQRKPKALPELDEERCLELMDRYAGEYQKQIIKLAPVVNEVSRHVPKRRKRKLHIGLFGYSRNVKGITLPRAITFTAALYSIGLPPEILGLNALNDADVSLIKDVYANFESDLTDALKYFNPDTRFLPKGLGRSIQSLSLDFQTDGGHKKMTDYISSSVGKNRNLKEHVVRAASLRRFLG